MHFFVDTTFPLAHRIIPPKLLVPTFAILPSLGPLRWQVPHRQAPVRQVVVVVPAGCFPLVRALGKPLHVNRKLLVTSRYFLLPAQVAPDRPPHLLGERPLLPVNITPPHSRPNKKRLRLCRKCTLVTCRRPSGHASLLNRPNSRKVVPICET